MVPLSITAIFATVTGAISAYGTALLTDDDDLTVPFLMALVLVIAVSFSPRIPLDLSVLARRRFDLRIEDLVLVIALLTLLIARSPPDRRIELPRYFVALLGYFAVAGLVTAVGVATTDLSVFRGLFYFLKETEYVLFALVVANVIRTRRQLYIFTVVFVGCALANAGWAGYQLLAGSTGPLFRTVEVSGFYGQPVGASGTALIGEPSRLASGGFYIAPICMVCGWLMMARETDRIRWWVFAGLALGVALVASLSRASILSTAVALFLLVLLIDRTPNYWIVLIPTVGLVGSLAVAPFVPISRFQPSYVLQSVITRFEKWDPILSSLDVASVLGAGKGSLTVVSGVEEAHNFYLRVFVEAGILGLLALLTTLVLIVAAGYTISRKSRDPVVASIGVAAFCATLSVAVASLFQDALINVKLAESYWLLVGALGAALRLATAHL